MRFVLVISNIYIHPSPPGSLILQSSYELQVSKSVQRGGVGKTLIKCLYDIARGWDMQKIMLTVFKGDDSLVL